MIIDLNKVTGYPEYQLRLSPETAAEQDQLWLLDHRLEGAGQKHQAYCNATPDKISHLDIDLCFD